MRRERAQGFGALLRSYRKVRGLRCNALAREVGVDPSYISRLERAEREPPRRPIVERLCAALRLDRHRADHLLLAAGYAPASLLAPGVWGRALAALAARLADPALADHSRASLQDLLWTLAEYWSDGEEADAAVPTGAATPYGRRAQCTRQ